MSLASINQNAAEVLRDVEGRFGTRLPGALANRRQSERAESVRKCSKIMLVDDEPLNIDVVRAFLEADGYQRIVATSDPRAALRLVLEERPDALLLDVQMPYCGGISILESIRADARLSGLPVIVLTAVTEQNVKLQALELGATDFLHKPVHAPELLTRVRNILVTKAQETELWEFERQGRVAAERELRAAEQIQSQLYPKSPPQIQGLDVAGAAYSAGMGCGDYFDFLPLSESRVAIVVADVSGHGMPSALRMVEARAYLRSLVRHHVQPGEILTELNGFLLRESAYGTESNSQFITLFLAVIDAAEREFVYASAGHPGYIVRSCGETLRLDSTFMPLGIAESPIAASNPIQLMPGDLLCVATDGVVEAASNKGELFGEARMLAALRVHRQRSASGVLDGLCSDVRVFTGQVPQQDDITVVVARN